jgi:hypothetical protein
MRRVARDGLDERGAGSLGLLPEPSDRDGTFGNQTVLPTVGFSPATTVEFIAAADIKLPSGSIPENAIARLNHAASHPVGLS